MSSSQTPMKKNRVKMTPMQSQILVDILYENSDIACGKLPARLPQEREERLRKWEAVATLLNSKGLGPQKTADLWKKSWHDLKFATRAKAAKLELAGGTNLMNEKLSTLEKRVLRLCGDVRIENTEGNESKEKLSDKLFLQKLEEDLAKTEEDLLKVVKRRNEIVIPKTFSQILEERRKKYKKQPIVENVVATTEENEQNETVETDGVGATSSVMNDGDGAASPVMNDDDPVADNQDYNNDSSEDDMKYAESDVDEETAENIVLCERISPPPKRRKTAPSVDIASTTSSPPKSFIAVFQSQIETQTAVLKEQTSVMRDIAKSLRLIAASLHSS